MGGLPPPPEPFNVWLEDHDATGERDHVVCHQVNVTELLRDAYYAVRILKGVKTLVFPV